MAAKRDAFDRENNQYSMRLDPEILSRADALVEYLSKREGKVATRTDVMRIAVVRGIREMERDSKRDVEGGKS